MLEISVVALSNGISMALCSGTVLHAWWQGILYSGMVSCPCFGGLAGTDGGAASSCWSQAAASRAMPWLLPRGKLSVSSKGEHTSGWKSSDVNDWQQGLGIELKNYIIRGNRCSLSSFSIFKTWVTSFTPDASSSSKYATLYLKLVSGNNPFSLIILSLEFSFDSFPIFLPVLLYLIFLPKCFFCHSSFLQVHISHRNVSLHFALSASHLFWLIPILSSISSSSCFRQQDYSQLTLNTETCAITTDEGMRTVNYSIKILRIFSLGVIGVWKRKGFLGSSRCFVSSSDRKMD